MRRLSYLAVLAAAAACYTALGAVLRVLPELVHDRAALGLLVGAPAITAVLTRPLGGRLADRVGPARVMVAGAAVMAAGAAPAIARSSIGVLLASRLAVGAGEGAMMSAAVLWLLRLAGPERRGQALGQIGLANYAGLAAGPLLVTVLALPSEAVFAVAALLPLAGVALTARAERPPSASAGPSGDGALRYVLVPGAGLMLVNVGYVAFLAFGTSATGTSLAVPLFAAGVIAARTAGARLPDRLGGRRTVRIATALAAAGLALVAVGLPPAPALAGTCVLAVGQGLAVPGLGLLALARVPAERHGAAAGAFFAFFDAGVGLGGAVAGGVARATSPEGALALAAAAVAAAGLVTLPTRRARAAGSRGSRARPSRSRVRPPSRCPQ